GKVLLYLRPLALSHVPVRERCEDDLPIRVPDPEPTWTVPYHRKPPTLNPGHCASYSHIQSSPRCASRIRRSSSQPARLNSPPANSNSRRNSTVSMATTLAHRLRTVNPEPPFRPPSRQPNELAASRFRSSRTQPKGCLCLVSVSRAPRTHKAGIVYAPSPPPHPPRVLRASLSPRKDATSDAHELVVARTRCAQEDARGSRRGLGMICLVYP